MKGLLLRQNDLVLVTGGAGYIGSHVVRFLLQKGYRVRVLDTLLYDRSGIGDCSDDPRLEFHLGDICSIRDIHRAAKGAKAIIALAALVGDGACELDRDETHAINVESTKLLCETVRAQTGIERVVFASSCSVYGATEGLVLNEGSKLNPVSFYARTRILSENILRKALEDRSVAVLRLGTVFGASPRMRFDLLVNTMTHAAVRKRTITVTGGQAWRPHVHCRDAAAAFVLAAEASHDKVSGETFNIGADQNNFTISETAVIVASQVSGTNIEYFDAVEDLRSYRVSFDKVRHVLGFVPRYRVEDGVNEVRALLEKNAVDADDPACSNLKFLKLHGFERGRQQEPVLSVADPGRSAAS
jgi:nucleoside-diphosphate-sugar epimerase